MRVAKVFWNQPYSFWREVTGSTRGLHGAIEVKTLQYSYSDEDFEESKAKIDNCSEDGIETRSDFGGQVILAMGDKMTMMKERKTWHKDG